MRWLITGGCGFIGSNFVRYLQQEGNHSIRVLDNLSVGSKNALADVGIQRSVNNISDVDKDGPRNGQVELIEGDIQDPRLTVAAAQGIDIIVHLAANTGVAPSVEDPRSDCQTNVIGTLNLLEAARCNKTARFVFASSGAPIGSATPPIHEEMAPRPVSPYGASKLAGEAYCSAYWGSYGLETTALRFGNVYGPDSHHKGSVVAKFIKDALSGNGLEIYGDGRQTRDFIYVEDLLDALKRAALARDVQGEVFQIATNSETTIDELASQLVSILTRHQIEDIPVHYCQARVGDVLRNYSDTTKAKQRLGWAPKYSLEQGLEKTVMSFLA